MFLIFRQFGTLDFAKVFDAAKGMPTESGYGILTIITLASAGGRDRKIGADPAVRLAAGRNGRPDAGIGA